MISILYKNKWQIVSIFKGILVECWKRFDKTSNVKHGTRVHGDIKWDKTRMHCVYPFIQNFLVSISKVNSN